MAEGLTIRDFAQRVGVTPGYISRIERGIQEPSWKLLCNIKKNYPTFSVDNLVTGDQQVSQMTPAPAKVLPRVADTHQELLVAVAEEIFRIGQAITRIDGTVTEAAQKGIPMPWVGADRRKA